MLDVMNGTYGCETGCEYITYVVVCKSCDKIIYVKGDFGSFDDDKEKRKYISNISLEELQEAINKKREFNDKLW